MTSTHREEKDKVHLLEAPAADSLLGLATM
jgi:hypothetical protein